MTTKLTLTIENKVIVSAKKYARLKGRSLSDIVENYLKSVLTEDSAEEKFSPKVAKLMGVIKLPDDFDYKTEISQITSEKYK